MYNASQLVNTMLLKLKKPTLILNHHDLKNTQLYTFTPDMRAFLRLLQPIGIKFFSFTRIHNDGSVEELTTHPSYDELFIREGFHKQAFNGNIEEYHSGIFLMEDLGCQHIAQSLYESTKTKNGWVFVKTFSKYVEIFFFAHDYYALFSKKSFENDQIIKLEEFIVEFREKAFKMLKKSWYLNRLTYDTSCAEMAILDNTTAQNNYYTKLGSYHIFDILLHDKLNEMAYKYALTEQEYLCLSSILSGLSVHEISVLRGCSKRTVETHFNSIRYKTNTKTLLELTTTLNRL